MIEVIIIVIIITLRGILVIIRRGIIKKKSVFASGEIAVVHFTVEARSATAAPSGNCHQFVAEDSNEL